MYSLYPAFCEKFILPLADFATRNRIMSLYKFYKEAQWWERDRLQEYQDAMIRKTIKTAYEEVPLYKELYDNCKINVNKICKVTDLALLPVVTKEALRNSYPDKCTRKTGWPWREYFTSGSSGKPFAVRVDNFSMSQARALMFLRANYSGWNIGDPYLQTGMTLNRGVIKKYKDFLMGVQYVSAFDLSDRVLDSYLAIIEKKKLQFVMGYAGSLYCLGMRASATGFNRIMKGIVSWGDNLYGHYREKIEKAFQCRVTDTYGCGEGIQVAAQCGLSEGAYHVFMPHVVVEIVDEEGYPSKPGDIGNIVLTLLEPGAMPLIRYKVGDIGRKNITQSCACGRGLDMLAKIEGRDTDVVVTPNGNRLIVHFFTGIIEYYQTIDTFRVIQDKSDEITVEIVPRPDFKEEHWNEIHREILTKGDPALKVQLRLVDNIPLEKSNKRRFVISRIHEATPLAMKEERLTGASYRDR